MTLSDGTELAQPSGYSSYWGIYKNGASCQEGNDGKNVDVAAAGVAFQFAWTDSVVNSAPTADQWAALKAKAEGADPAPTPEPTPKPPIPRLLSTSSMPLRPRPSLTTCRPVLPPTALMPLSTTTRSTPPWR